ncbi:hypothetical protein AVEN_237975-1 [Araneus ventricosus]|uniref:Uncharacterized protein n=1 Tax=Araneus ventricosus TaxID=182803 RepID=A0A4Y2G1Q7_ARAVE|nr:hypothetical protein AVEN_237975-1 [Araneus ventricosus]
MLENHTFDKKSEKPLVLHYRLAVLLNSRGTDVFNLELDKQTKHSSRGVSLSWALGKTICWPLGEQMWIRTQVLPPVYPESNSLGNKECIEHYHLQFIFK